MTREVKSAVVLAALATLLLGPAGALAVEQGKDRPATVEAISGGTTKRVTLSARAAERLGIELAEVDEAAIIRKQMVGGLVVSPPEAPAVAKVSAGRFGGFGQVTAALGQPPVVPVEAISEETWVRVTLSPAEWERLDKERPARVLTLTTGDRPGDAVMARPSGIEPVEDPKRTMLTVHYVVPGAAGGLQLSQRVRVELRLAGSDVTHKVVPYGAVYYDPTGAAWVYVATAPLVFERHPITVDHVAGDVAVLSAGPAVGTPVVKVGAPLLYGAEILGK
jgi:hypothetical protein